MKEFTVLSDKGIVLRSGTCEDAYFAQQALNPGETVVEGKQTPPPSTAMPTWSGNRHNEYPSTRALGDALYWQSKGDDSKLMAYFQQCEAVKQKYPKP